MAIPAAGASSKHMPTISISICFSLVLSFLLATLSFAFLFIFLSSTFTPFSFHYDYIFSTSSGSSSSSSGSSESSPPSPSPSSLSIFASPHLPFLSFSPHDPLFRALSSWIHLMPSSHIFLLGSHPSFFNASLHLPGKVSVEPHIDRNFLGTPHFHSMLARAHQTRSAISLLVMDTNIVFLQGFLEAMCRAMQMHREWVIFGRDWEHLGGGVAFWAWNNNEMGDHPLFPAAELPPFSHVAGTYEDWLLHYLTQREAHPRAVIDATDARITARIDAMMPSGSAGTSRSASPSWESDINAMLLSKMGNVSVSIPWRLVHCAEAKVRNLCMIEVEDEGMDGRRRPCRNDGSDQRAAPAAMSHSLDELLPQVADENKVVVMVGGTANYKEMMLSFICRVQALGIKNVLVAAFDEALFEFAYMRGLAVYMERSSEDYRPVIGGDGHCIFASECFKHVSKLKSTSVLRVLRKGYSVFWSDIDIHWFRNPLPDLLAYGPGTLPIQSDEPDERRPENNIRGANSGFYLARAEESTIKAFRAIVGHAMATDLTEQPSFYDVLCGEKGEKRVGDRECSLGEGGLRTIFLSREQFPNGQVFRHWESDNATMSCREKGCVVLHNNFITGRENKMRRFVMNGMWFYDVEQGMCLQPWHPFHPSAHQRNLSAFQAHFLSALHLPDLRVPS